MTALDHLDSGQVRATVARLEQRIGARFPDRGIRRLAVRLQTLVDEVAEQNPTITRRIRAARTASRGLAVVVLVATLVVVALAVRVALDDPEVESGLDWLPLIETTVNDLVFAAIALFFLYSLPDRVQRRQQLALLHRLRSLAHVIDMHQLTKDPERLRLDFVRTRESPDPRLTGEQLEYYLDYCSEMLSLLSKTAALVAEDSQDALVLDAVTGVEELTTGMSRKIWQKIMVLNAAR